MKDQLFVLRPGFTEHGITYFCPYSAQVIGFLTYYPQVRDTVELHELDFAKPRRTLVDLVGEAHQSPPLLVLAGEPVRVPDVNIGEANSYKFVAKTIEILRYLSVTRGVPVPH